MSKDVLNQSEVESLPSALESGLKRAAPSDTEGAASRTRGKIATYDLKRSERVGKEQMRALETLHEGFSRNFGAALSALLRSTVKVKLIGVDQLTYSDFIFSLENPTCFNLMKADPLEGNLILDINPSILYPIIDRLLGGGIETTTVARRPLTDIELRLVARITGLFLNQLTRAWENVLKLDLAITRVESNPHSVQIMPPNEVVVLISFELTLGDIRGMIKLCVPSNAIERIGGKLTSNSWVAHGQRLATPRSIERDSRNLEGSQVEIVVDLAESKISTRDLVGLRVGDIIATHKDVHSPLDVYVEGKPKFHARPGAFKGYKAICVEETIAPESQSARET